MQDYLNYQKQKKSSGQTIATQGQLFTLSGLNGATLMERIIFENGSEGFVFSIEEDVTDIVLTSGHIPHPGIKAVRTGKTVSFTTSDHLLGQVLSPLGKNIVTDQVNAHGETLDLTGHVYGIADRLKITNQCLTGSLFVDTLLPLGQGQRELLLGDRKTGKTRFALDALINQPKETVCIYVAIAKSLSSVKALRQYLEQQKKLDQTVIIASSPEDPAGLIHLTPLSGMRLAEYFRDQGRNVLIILDDLSSHARSYRQISLLARRFPGRNAYPGDIFYVHAHLLERAGNFKFAKKEVSITCLPIAETQQGDLTGYIPTNLMSMTDGHLYFDEDRFLEGKRPAIHPFLSVTRVGRQTKTPLLREAISEMTSFLSKAERLTQISHFGQELSDDAKTTLAKAHKLETIFNLPELGRYTEWFSFFIICLVWDGYWNHADDETLVGDIKKLHQLSHQEESRIKKLLTEPTFASAGKDARMIADSLFLHNP